MPRCAPSPLLPFLRAGAVLAAATACAAAVASELPSRKAGLWEVTIQTAGSPDTRTRQCIDSKTDAQLQQMGQGMSQSACSKNVMRREGSTWVSESVCRMGNSTITSRGVLSGDFERELRMVVDAQYAPPLMGMSKGQTVITQRHAGACPAGWKPGDMELPGMQKRMNVTELPGMAGKPAR